MPCLARAGGVVREGPIVETQTGRVAGVTIDGVASFKGVPYAAARRFAAARPVAPWRGVRPTIAYGPACPGLHEARDASASVFAFMMPSGETGSFNEDCLRLNVWTRRDWTRPRAVMVWLHAGGFERGYAQEYPGADGSRLAALHDVVVVSLNHRLGPLGFLKLESAPDAANAGMHDIVAALRWVRDNIAAFGGDPGRITLFGQSGGGFKIATLLAMPHARRLFHRAIIQSGVRLRLKTPAASDRLTSALLLRLSVSDNTAGLERLRAMPADTIMREANAASAALRRQSPAVTQAQSPDWRFEPTVGGADLPDHPGAREVLERVADIPVICGTCRNEISSTANHPELEAMDWQALAAMVRAELGDRTDAAIAAARRVDPAWTPADVLTVLQTREFRQAAVDYCRAAAAAGNKSVRNYLFDWRTPLFGGRPRAFHASDVAFVFDQTELAWRQTGGGARAARLGTAMSGAWSAFARDGIPAIPGGPEWRPFGPRGEAAAIFDDRIRVRDAPDAPLLRGLAA